MVQVGLASEEFQCSPGVQSRFGVGDDECSCGVDGMHGADLRFPKESASGTSTAAGVSHSYVSGLKGACLKGGPFCAWNDVSWKKKESEAYWEEDGQQLLAETVSWPQWREAENTDRRNDFQFSAVLQRERASILSLLSCSSLLQRGGCHVWSCVTTRSLEPGKEVRLGDRLRCAARDHADHAILMIGSMAQLSQKQTVLFIVIIVVISIICIIRSTSESLGPKSSR